MVSSHSRLELSLLTSLLATQRYQPVWLRLMLVTLITLASPRAKAETLPPRVSCCHAYRIGPVPLSRLQRIHMAEPSTGDASLIRSFSMLTAALSEMTVRRPSVSASCWNLVPFPKLYTTALMASVPGLVKLQMYRSGRPAPHSRITALPTTPDTLVSRKSRY
ncbi:hypothetical protein EYF80_026331 [Liparis tanakae]|uniref:Uncharacterized protein n=1 Tax=Liparis tanakae TaxID=230148 RepID=A0A4Z2HCX0_9TELE|nr:hypothetical protein EYF80_026331 [Liparis tanakae]